MKRYIIYLFLYLVTSFSLLSCMDSYLGIEQLDLGAGKPEKLTVDKVVSKPGALEIHFSLPAGNPKHSQVIASYKNKAGNEVQFKVSRYSHVILVEGFTGTDEVFVELAVVDEGGNKSDITQVREKPLLSPVEIARQSLEAIPAFGGVKLHWENKEAQPFAIHVLTEDQIQMGEKTLIEDPSKRIYSADSLNTTTYIRQYDNVEQKFGFVISDKWGNRTDTLIKLITPYKEQLIDYNTVKPLAYFNPSYGTAGKDYALFGYNLVTGIQNDGISHSAAFGPQTMFNGVTAANNFLAYKFFKIPEGQPTQRTYVHDLYVTVDLSQDLRLSRIQIYPRPSASYLYARSSVKRFRIWGTNDANSTRWSKFPEGWILIGEYVGKMPANMASITQEETDYFYNKQEYAISEDNVNPNAKPTESFRYMRLQLMESYTPTETFYTINEFKMFGEVLKSY